MKKGAQKNSQTLTIGDCVGGCMWMDEKVVLRTATAIKNVIRQILVTEFCSIL